MKKSGWRGWLSSVAQTLGGQRDRLEATTACRKRTRRLELERLEDRLAPAAGFLFNAVPTVTSYTLRQNGGNLELVDANNLSHVLASQALNATSAVQINGRVGDTLTVDFGFGGAFSVAGGITFAAAGSGTLDVKGGTFASLTDNAAGPGAGSLDFHPSSGSDTVITYSGLAPINVTSTATNVNVQLPAGATDAVLQAGPTTGTETISATGGTFESMTFNDPTGTLSVTSAAGAADVLNVKSLSSSFDANLSIDLTANTSGTSEINFTGANTLTGAENITASANKVAVNAALSTGGNVTINTAAVSEGASGGVTAAGLLFTGSTSVFFENASNNVGTLAANVSGDFYYANSGSLTIGTVGATSGVSSTNGTVNVAALLGDLTVSQGVSAGTTVVLNAGSSTSSPDHILTTNAVILGNTGVTFTADRMALVGGYVEVAGGTQPLILQPFSSGRTIDLGGTGDPTGTLQLSQAELGSLYVFSTNAIVRIGNASAGNITVTAPISNSIYSNNLSLITGGSVAETGTGAITYPGLAVQAANGADLSTNVSSIATVAASSSGGGFTLSDSVINASSGLTVGTVDGVNGIQAKGAVTLAEGQTAQLTLTVNQAVASTAGNVTFQYDQMALNAAVSATGNRVTLAPFTAGQLINLGGADANGTLGLTAAELQEVTAATLQVGDSAAGALSISSAITLTTVTTLDLESGAAVGDDPSSTAGAVNVADLAVRAAGIVNLSAEANTVTTLAVAVAGSSNGFLFTDSGGLTVGTADGLNGVAAEGGVLITTGAGATLAVDQAIDTTGGGAVPGGNNIFLNADAMTIAAGLDGGTSGIVGLEVVTNGRNIYVGTKASGVLGLTQAELDFVTARILRIGDAGYPDPPIIVTAPIVAPTTWNTLELIDSVGSGTVSQNAGDSITVANLVVVAPDGVSLTDPGNTVSNFGGSLLNEGGAFTFVNSTSLTIADVDASVGGDGVQTPGSSVSITALGAGSLLTVNAVVNTTLAENSGANVTLSADDMAVNAAVNAGTGVATLQQGGTTARDIDLGGGTTAGDLGLADAELAEITASVLRVGRSDNSGNITVTAAVPTEIGFSTLDLISGGTISQAAAADSITVSNLAAQGATVNLNSTGNTVAELAGATSGAFTFVNSGALSVNGVDGVAGVVTTAGAISISTVIGDLTATDNVEALGFQAVSLTAGATVGAASTFSNPSEVFGGSITVTADLMNLLTTLQANGGRIVLKEFTAKRGIDLGNPFYIGSTTLDLSAAELNEANAGVLQVGDGNAGNITVSAAVGPTNAGTFDLETGAGVVEAGSGSMITVANLVLRTVAGVGSAGALAVVGPVNVAIDNTTSGAVQISSTGKLTVASVDGLTASTNAGGATSLSAASPVEYAVNMTSAGTFTSTATETTPAATGFDDITVDAGVTVESTGGDVIFLAGDDITIAANATVEAPTGNIDFRAGFSDNDNEGVMTLNGAVAANATTGTVTLNVLSSNSALAAGTDLVAEGAAGSVVGANLLLLNGANSSSGAFALDGSVSNQIGTIAASTQASVRYQNAGALVVGTVTSPDESASAAGVVTNGNAIVLSTVNGNLTVNRIVNAGANNIALTAGGANNLLAVNAAVTVTGGNTIALTADQMNLNSSVSSGPAGSGLVVLDVFTTGQGIVLGTKPSGSLGLNAADLGNITVGAALRIGDTGGLNAGITLTAAVAAPAGWNDLELLSSGTVSQGAGDSITVTNLAARGDNGVSLADPGNTVTNLGGRAGQTGPFTFVNSTSLAVNLTDNSVGISGVESGGADINVTALGAGSLLTVNAAIDTTIFEDFGGNITLSADDMAINAAVNADLARVTLQQGGTATRNVDVGNGTTAGDLDLTDAEVAEAICSTLQIGRPDNPGGVTVTASVTVPESLILVGGANVTVDSNFTVDSTGGNVTLTAGANVVTQNGSVVKSDTNGVTLDIGTNGLGAGASSIGGTVEGTSPTVNGGSGANFLTIDFAAGAALPNGLTFNGGASGADALTVNDAGTGSPHAYTLTDAAVVRDGGLAIAINNLGAVTANGGNQGDRFSVTPSLNTAFAFIGGAPAPPTSPGDELDLTTLPGTPVLSDGWSRASGYAGVWSFGGAYKSVSFTGVETLNPISSNIVELGPTGSNNSLAVTATGPTGGTFQLNGGEVITFFNANSLLYIPQGPVNGLTINNPAGGLLALPGYVLYDGAPGAQNSLSIVGGVATTEVESFGANNADGSHNGFIRLTNGGVTASISYTYLTPQTPLELAMGTPSTVTFNLPDDGKDDRALLQASSTSGETEISSQTGGFEDTTFFNPSDALGINVESPLGQTVSLIGLDPAFEAPVIGINGGTGADDYLVRAMPHTVVYVVGSGAGTLNYDAEGLTVGTLPGLIYANTRLTTEYGGIARITIDSSTGVDAADAPNTLDRAAAFAGLTAPERYVQALFLDVYGHAEPKAVVDSWAADFGQPGVTQAQAELMIAAGIEQQQEARERLVAGWYVSYFGRQPAGGEQQPYVDQLLAGASEESVLAQVLALPEFYTRAQSLSAYATADQRYVDALYQALDLRPATAAEAANGAATVASFGRAAEALSLLMGQTSRTAQFEGYYDARLRRPADAASLMNDVFSNTDMRTLRIDMEASGEFYTNG